TRRPDPQTTVAVTEEPAYMKLVVTVKSIRFDFPVDELFDPGPHVEPKGAVIAFDQSGNLRSPEGRRIELGGIGGPAPKPRRRSRPDSAPVLINGEHAAPQRAVL